MSKFFINRPIVRGDRDPYGDCGRGHHHTLPVAQFPNIVRRNSAAGLLCRRGRADPGAIPSPLPSNSKSRRGQHELHVLAERYGNSTNHHSRGRDLKTTRTPINLTQSREQLAAGQLPPEVNTYGVTIKKSVTAPLMLVGLFSPKGTFDTTYLGNYAYITSMTLSPACTAWARHKFSARGSMRMRLWVQPDKLAKLASPSRTSSMRCKRKYTVRSCR